MSNARQSNSIFAGALRLGLGGRLLLVLLLWHGPVPVWHSHDSFSSDSSLKQHLTCCHSDDGDATARTGMHLHLVMPNEPAAGSEQDDNLLPTVEAALFVECGVSDSCEQSLLVGVEFGLCEAVPPVPVELRQGQGGRSRAFFEDFAAHLAVPVRLGVLRI